jgi:hypothetical protein
MHDARHCAHGAAPEPPAGMPPYYTLCTWVTPEKIAGLPTWIQRAAQHNSLNPLDCDHCPAFVPRDGGLARLTP